MNTAQSRTSNPFKVTSRIRCCIIFFFCCCKSDQVDDPIPPITFPDYVANLSAPEYAALLVDGGYKEVNNIGVRGVIIYRKDMATYMAFERNCSYHPNEACATVNVHSSKLYLSDPCCSSTFSFETGKPTGGIAWRPLRLYHTELNGGTLTITSEIAK